MSDGVPQNKPSVAEPLLIDQLQFQSHTIREEPFSASDDHGADDHLKLIDQTSPYCVRSELRTINRQVARALALSRRTASASKTRSIRSALPGSARVLE